MFTKRRAKTRQAFTLMEVMVATGLAGIVVSVIAMLAYFTSRSFVAATNYTDMALLSRMALDNISRTIRQSSQVTSYSTNSITLMDPSGNTVQYSLNPTTKTLLAVSGGTTN